MLIPENRRPTTPGDLLREDVLKPLGMTQTAMAARLDIPPRRLNEIIHGKRRVTVSTALRLSKVLNTTPDFWLNMQMAVDLYKVLHDDAVMAVIDAIVPVT